MHVECRRSAENTSFCQRKRNTILQNEHFSLVKSIGFFCFWISLCYFENEILSKWHTEKNMKIERTHCDRNEFNFIHIVRKLIYALNQNHSNVPIALCRIFDSGISYAWLCRLKVNIKYAAAVSRYSSNECGTFSHEWWRYTWRTRFTCDINIHDVAKRFKRKKEQKKRINENVIFLMRFCHFIYRIHKWWSLWETELMVFFILSYQTS